MKNNINSLKRIEQKVISFISNNNLINKNDKILTALSGGPDSVFLLYFLQKYKKKYGIEIGAIHINHMLRGRDADEDQNFCRKLSLSLGIKFYTVKKNVKLFAKRNKLSVEEAGRILRYKEFYKALKISGYNKVATAHNSSDNAETVLLNLIKGAGLKGLSGIPAKRDNLIRPVLCLTKDEILSCLNFYKTGYKTDLTNLNNDYERSFLRNSVIPLIKEKLNPDFENTALNESDIFKNIFSYVENKTKDIFKNTYNVKEGRLVISTARLKQIEPELEGYFFKSVFYEVFGLQITYSGYKSLKSLINSEPGKEVNISGKYKAFRDREFIIIFKEKFVNIIKPVYLKTGDTLKLSGKTLSIENVNKLPEKYSGSKLMEYISADNLNGIFVLRAWQTGDRFFPLGMKSTKKVSDFLVEQKISSLKKKEQLVLTNKDRIVWVLGLRLDDRFKILQNTEKVIKLCLK